MIRLIICSGGMFLALAFTASAMAQQNAEVASVPDKSVQLLRVIHDPSTRTRWLLYRDPSHPAAPAHLIPESEAAEVAGFSGTLSKSIKSPDLVIHAGDRVSVEEHTAVSSMYLEGVALSSAAEGEPLKVRLDLSMGQKQIAVLAVGPGRARIQPPSGE